MIKDCGFYTFAQLLGKNSIGSSRIRAEWLCNYWPEAEIFVMGQEYKTVVFQKAYWPEYAKLFKGTKILDVCDVRDIDWDLGVKSMIDLCDGITTSTENIAEYIRTITKKPVKCIPDRLDFIFFQNEKKKHEGDAKIAVWQGYDSNFAMLAWTLPDLIKNKIEKLIVISNKSYDYPIPKEIRNSLEIINIPWEEKTINQNLLLGDIVINPQFNEGKWQYKSNNKTISAWALGLPVAQTEKELEFFISENNRKIESEIRYVEVRKNYDVSWSVIELKKFINDLKIPGPKNHSEELLINPIKSWSDNTKYLKKYLHIAKLRENSQRQNIDRLLGKFGIIIQNYSPRTYNFLKTISSLNNIYLYLDFKIGRLGFIIKNKNPQLYNFLKRKKILSEKRQIN